MRYGDWALPGIATGHVLDVLAKLPENSVQTVCTSPPYWGLRDYKTPPQVWDGEPTCKHQWAAEKRVTKTAGQGGPGLTLRGGNVRPDEPWNQGTRLEGVSTGQFCAKCLAWRGNLGNEPTPEMYVAHMVAIFRAVRRVLRDDGVLWLNLGDSYVGANNTDSGGNANFGSSAGVSSASQSKAAWRGLAPKNLVGIPWRVAFALQADGWWLRSDIVWGKKNCMPESCTDRPTRSHEYIFLLTKSARYYFDMEAVKEACESGPSDVRKMQESLPRIGGKHKILVDPFSKASAETNIGQKRSVGSPNGRNIRSVWTITADPYRDAHFATFPREIPRRAILAGTSEKGCCPTCGTPWERIVERQSKCDVPRGTVPSSSRAPGQPQQAGVSVAVKTVGWKAACKCPAHEPIPCTVMDIFAGSGTTLRVAEDLGRLWFGIDLSDQYLTLIKKRTAQRTVLGLAGRLALKKK